jgi:hypothetical protein
MRMKSIPFFAKPLFHALKPDPARVDIVIFEDDIQNSVERMGRCALESCLLSTFDIELQETQGVNGVIPEELIQAFPETALNACLPELEAETMHWHCSGASISIIGSRLPATTALFTGPIRPS